MNIFTKNNIIKRCDMKNRWSLVWSIQFTKDYLAWLNLQPTWIYLNILLKNYILLHDQLITKNKYCHKFIQIAWMKNNILLHDQTYKQNIITWLYSNYTMRHYKIK